jgi:3-methyl-2-oxobutanoate hydroxymethyltransferase
MKEAGRPITMLTAYDAPLAALADAGSVDVVLVGDSLGQVVHGFDTTLPVTMEMMILHTQAVARGAKRALLVTDMPFMSYQVSPDQTLVNAGRLLKEGGAEAVKLETNNERIIETVKYIVDAGIPVIGHIGLTPQSIHALGGYKVQGRREEDAERLKQQALAVERAGACAVVLELMPRDLARQITASLGIPTIGIGAGADCDGQVLVLHDLLGLTEHPPRFAKKYVDMRNGMLRAVRKYTRDVRERLFPAKENEFE